MTTEEQLKAIIAAQVRGGAKLYRNNGDGFRSDLVYWCGYHILEILLDLEGLKAAYGNAPVMVNEEYGHKVYDANWNSAARVILGSWLSSNGDTAQTIETAYRLLPQ